MSKDKFPVPNKAIIGIKPLLQPAAPGIEQLLSRDLAALDIGQIRILTAPAPAELFAVGQVDDNNVANNT